MSRPPDDYEPTEADLDLVVEAATGRPLPPANLAAGITSLQQRLAQLATEKSRLLDRMADANAALDQSLQVQLAAITQDLTNARQRLAHYEAQHGKEN